MEERNLILEIENIINCGRKKEDPYFSLRDKFRERIFTPPVQPCQMIFFWTLPETFNPEDLDKEFSLGYKHFAADVYNESINSMIDKMREHSKNMNRLFVCPCTDNETREKILDALHIIFPERKKDTDVLYNKVEHHEPSKEIVSMVNSLKALKDSEGNKIFSDAFLDRMFLQKETI